MELGKSGETLRVSPWKINSPDSGDTGLNCPLFAGAGATLRTLQEVVDQLGAGVPHLHVESFDFVREVVEHHDRGDGNEQSDSGGNEGFGNTACHGRQTGRLLVGNSLERVNDADYRSEQTDERRGGTDSSEAADTALEFSTDNGFRAGQSTLGGVDLFAGDVGADLVGLKFLQTRH